MESREDAVEMNREKDGAGGQRRLCTAFNGRRQLFWRLSSFFPS